MGAIRIGGVHAEFDFVRIAGIDFARLRIPPYGYYAADARIPRRS
jgi:hypothetical protein